MDEYQHARFPAVALDGSLVGVVVAKRGYMLGEDRVPRPSPLPTPLRFADVLVDGDDPTASPVRLEADTVPHKDRTDLVVLAIAHAPGGLPVPGFEVSIAVGVPRRVLQVFGPRQVLYRGPAHPSLKEPVRTLPVITDPEPVARVPMTPAYAYGGKARMRLPGSEDVLDVACPANPFGKGYCVQNSPEGMADVWLPQVEDPADLLTPETVVRAAGTPEAVPVVATLGTFGRAWYPRSAYSGVPPYEADRVRAQVRGQADALDPESDADAIAMLRAFEPQILAPEFFQCASPGLAVPILAGDEAVTLRNLSSSGLLSFNLPGRAPQVLPAGSEPRRPIPMALDTVVLDVEAGLLELTFRGQVPMPSPEAVEAFLKAAIEVRDVELAEARRVVAD